MADMRLRTMPAPQQISPDEPFLTFGLEQQHARAKAPTLWWDRKASQTIFGMMASASDACKQAKWYYRCIWHQPLLLVLLPAGVKELWSRRGIRVARGSF